MLIFTVQQLSENANFVLTSLSLSIPAAGWRSLELKERSSILALWSLKKTFDRVLREVIRLAMHTLGVEEWLVSAEK